VTYGRHERTRDSYPLSDDAARSDSEVTVLEWLAQALVRIAPELRELVEEEHAVMRECPRMSPEHNCAGDNVQSGV
jgi:hypothetical protein